MTTFEATTRHKGVGNDPTGLARWVSVLMEGRENHKTRFVQAYNPCFSEWLNSVYQQQARYLRDEKRKENPHKAFEKDFKAALVEWLGNGDSIVVSIDANQDVLNGRLQRMFASLGLRNIIKEMHPNLPMPATYARNENDKTIDAIFTNIEHPDMRCGYLTCHESFPGDHRPMFLDVPKTAAWGHNPPHLFKPTSVGLSTNDPRIRKAYHKRVLAGFRKHNVVNKAAALRTMVSNNAPVEQIAQAHEELYYLNLDIREAAAEGIRKKRMGKVEWSPQYQLLRDRRHFWTMLIKKLKRVRMNKRFLLRLMKRACIKGSLDVTLDEAQEKRNEAHRLCLEAKKLAPQWCKSHLQGLADALAEFHQQLPAQVLKNLRHRETIRRKAQRVKALSKNQKGPKYTSLFHTVDGTRIECSDKVSMEKACTAESLLRYTRCHSSPFYKEPLLSALGVLADTEAAEQILQGSFEVPPELDPHTKAIIGLLQRPPTNKCLDITAVHVTADKIAKAWKR